MVREVFAVPDSIGRPLFLPVWGGVTVSRIYGNGNAFRVQFSTRAEAEAFNAQSKGA